MSVTITTTGVCLEVLDCPSCGVEFAAPSRIIKSRRESGGDIYCPNGHVSTWTDTELKRLRRELAAEQQRANRERQMRIDEMNEHEVTQRRLAATKGVVTRTKNRVGCGVCPCCSRSFQNLKRHMQSKHPEYAESDN